MQNNQGTTPQENQERFVKHLETASELVRKWPGWKQAVLGGAKEGQCAGGQQPASAPKERPK
jgi:hypothetical protein